MADDEAAMGTESSPSQFTGQGTRQQQDPLVAVTFQKDPNRKQKFLEAEPKALGIAQIGLCVYQITWICVSHSNDLADPTGSIVHIILNLLVIIAGSLAISARNLHLPTLKACLGMQVLACFASLSNALGIYSFPDHLDCFDWDLYYHNDTTWEQWQQSEDYIGCHQVQTGLSHLDAGFLLIQAALVAISCTLASYCCKVVNCCSPASKMPVITVATSLSSPALQQ